MILVTGASGFIGHALCDRLQAAGRNYRPVGRGPRPGFLQVSALGPDTDWRHALEDVDTVIHLAARVHVLKDDNADPLAAYRETNVEGTMRLARQAADRGVRRFIFMSSVKVNGESTPPDKPFRADDGPAPSDPYGQSKFEAEVALRDLSRETEMDVVIIRPPLVYGPGVKANFRAMLTLVRKGVPLPFGSIHNRRSFVAVQNLVDLVLRCIDHPEASGKIFLVSDGADLSTPELLRALARSGGTSARLVAVPVPLLRLAAAAVGQRARLGRLVDWLQVDMDATRATLDWTPPLTIEEALGLAARQGW